MTRAAGKRSAKTATEIGAQLDKARAERTTTEPPHLPMHVKCVRNVDYVLTHAKAIEALAAEVDERPGWEFDTIAEWYEGDDMEGGALVTYWAWVDHPTRMAGAEPVEATVNL